MRTRRERPYWLGGSEICRDCAHFFVLEMGFHCSACDQPICGQCVLLDQVAGDVLCVACREEEEEAD